MTKPALKIEPGYRNNLERGIAAQLEQAGVAFDYERLKLAISYPPRVGKYLADFSAGDIILEGKGWFGRRSAHERQKFILAKAQHPHLDIRFVFQDASKPIYKNSPTSLGAWATANGFQWSDRGHIPPEWLEEIKERQRADGKTTSKHRKRSSPQATSTRRSASSRARS